ncbi:MAG: hypothetical protein RIM84_25045 [Alphaproteobacteria bacterium]
MSNTAGQRVWRALNSTQRYGARVALTWRKLLLPRGDCVFVAALPKSGSSFLVKALAEATGHTQMFLGYDHLNEQDLYLPRLIDSWGQNVVVHQHLRATGANLDLLKVFHVRPVLLRRDLADALVSLADHLNTESLATAAVTMPPAYRDWPRARQLQAVIDLAAPWYVQFLAGWETAAGDVDALVLDYAEVVADPAVAVATVLRHYRIERSAADIEAAVARARGGAVRFNRGIAGRGAAEFSAEQLARLDDLTRHYPVLRPVLAETA